MAQDYEDSGRHEYCPECGTRLLESRCPNCAQRETASIDESYAPGITIASDSFLEERRERARRSTHPADRDPRPAPSDDDDGSATVELNGTVLFESDPYPTYSDGDVVHVQLVFVVQNDGTVTAINIWEDPDASDPFRDVPDLGTGTALYACGYGDEFRGLDLLHVHLDKDHELEPLAHEQVSPPPLQATPLGDLDPGMGRVNLRAEFVEVVERFTYDEYPDPVSPKPGRVVRLRDDTGSVLMKAIDRSIPDAFEPGATVGVVQVEIKSAPEDVAQSVMAAAMNDAVFVDPEVVVPRGE